MFHISDAEIRMKIRGIIPEYEYDVRPVTRLETYQQWAAPSFVPDVASGSADDSSEALPLNILQQ
jgi:hypothetical protein